VVRAVEAIPKIALEVAAAIPVLDPVHPHPAAQADREVDHAKNGTLFCHKLWNTFIQKKDFRSKFFTSIYFC